MAKNDNVNVTKATKNGTKIVACTCKDAFQDRTYGKGQRVANGGAKGSRCTVCGAVK